jgi:hypothetical protein
VRTRSAATAALAFKSLPKRTAKSLGKSSKEQQHHSEIYTFYSQSSYLLIKV